MFHVAYLALAPERRLCYQIVSFHSLGSIIPPNPTLTQGFLGELFMMEHYHGRVLIDAGGGRGWECRGAGGSRAGELAQAQSCGCQLQPVPAVSGSPTPFPRQLICCCENLAGHLIQPLPLYSVIGLKLGECPFAPDT